jgi:hypothetical protein
VPPQGADFGGGLFGRLAVTEEVDHHVGPLPGEVDGDRFAYAPAGAGDQDDFVGKWWHGFPDSGGCCPFWRHASIVTFLPGRATKTSVNDRSRPGAKRSRENSCADWQNSLQ